MKTLCIFLLFFLFSHTPDIENKVILAGNVEITTKTEEFSPEALKAYISEKELLHPEIVYAQAIWETGGFESRIFKENNNLFGMKYIHDCNCSITRKGTRETTAIGSKYKHAVYDNWKSSVDDYLLWQKMFKKTPIVKETDYFTLLGKWYATDPNYVKHIKNIKNKQIYEK